MAGGRGKIDEYNKSLTPEQRKNNARRAARAKRPGATTAKTIREIAKIINNAPAQAQARDSLAKLGLKDKDMTNAALIAAAVFRAAFEGDMRAVEKWERYVGQAEGQSSGTNLFDELIEELRRPHDSYAEAAEIISGMGDGPTEADQLIGGQCFQR